MEILVTVALLAFIILGLVAMFNQTRRAFMSSITQVDVLESGRSTADLISREMEQIAPSKIGALTNFIVDSPMLSFGPTPFVIQPLVDPSESRTNNLQEVFFVTQDNNQQWNGIGYKLLDTSPGIGTLYRYSTTNGIYSSNIWVLTNQVVAFHNANALNMSRLIDGVVDFRVRTYDANGNLYAPLSPAPVYINANQTIYAATNPPSGDQAYSTFSSNAVPYYVEVELGVLEDRALARYQSLAISGTGPGTPARTYLVNHAGQVHIFRQRITIRNANQ